MNKSEAKEWLAKETVDIKDKFKKVPGLEDKIKLLEDDKTEFDLSAFESIKEEIDKLAGEENISEEKKNSIGNLTLLNADINRGYGNSYFLTKRRIIIEEDEKGKFIPICTKNVFLKYFDKDSDSTTKWRNEDIKKYQNKIGEKLAKFLSIKAKESNNEEI